MTKTKEHHAEMKDSSKGHFASDLKGLKADFAQLREDITKVLTNALGAGKNGAGMLKDCASTAVGDLHDGMAGIKDSGVESVEAVRRKLGVRPLLSASIAMGIGFVLARLITMKR